jgi:hypothetical protein
MPLEAARRRAADRETDMSATDQLHQVLDGDIAMAHERCVAAMQARLPNLELAAKERYFAVLSILVEKLEAQEKSMRDVLIEMMAEAGRHLMEEMSTPR